MPSFKEMNTGNVPDGSFDNSTQSAEDHSFGYENLDEADQRAVAEFLKRMDDPSSDPRTPSGKVNRDKYR